MSEFEYEIALLSRLIDVAVERARSIRGEADEAREDGTRTLLLECSELHDDIALELQTRVRELGGEPVAKEDNGRGAMAGNETGMPSSARPTDLNNRAQLADELGQAILDDRLSVTTRMVVRSCLEILRNEAHEHRRAQRDS